LHRWGCIHRSVGESSEIGIPMHRTWDCRRHNDTLQSLATSINVLTVAAYVPPTFQVSTRSPPYFNSLALSQL
jgi:hypothetical protein